MPAACTSNPNRLQTSGTQAEDRAWADAAGSAGHSFRFPKGPEGGLQSMDGGVVVSKERSWNFFFYVHSCTIMSLFSLPATHEISFHNGILLAPPHYDNTPDHCTVAHCPRSGACAAPPPPTRPWGSRERPRGGIGSGGQYFAANRSKGPSDCHRSKTCARAVEFPARRIRRLHASIVLYVDHSPFISTNMYLAH